MNRDPSRHTHRYHSEFMNYLWDKNEGHQTASQLSSASFFFPNVDPALTPGPINETISPST